MDHERLSFAQQESLVAILCYDDTHGKMLSGLLDPGILEGDYREIGIRVLGYWKQHKRAPRLHTRDLFADILEDADNPAKAKFYERTLYSMAMLAEGSLNAEYIIGSVQALTRWRGLQTAVFHTAEILKRPVSPENIEAAERAMRDVIKARNAQFDRGMRLDDDLEPFLAYLEKHHNEFSTGIAELDRRRIAPAREEMFLMIAGKGRGKSWLFININKRAIRNGKKVLHLSLENSEFETRLRYYQSMFGASRHDIGEIEVSRFERNRDGAVTAIRYDKEYANFDFENPEIQSELEARILNFGPRIGNLIIKRFPNRTLSVELYEAYLDRLEQLDGFIPDLVAIDYPKLMKMRSNDPSHWRLDLGYNTEELRRIAVERHHALVIVHQLTREGHKSGKARSYHASEDWTQTHTADVVIIHSATEAETEHGLCRLFVDHARGEKDKFEVLVSQTFETGAFVLDSALMPRERPRNYPGEKAADDRQRDSRNGQGGDGEYDEREEAGLMRDDYN
jgi:hypothetical protein